MCRTHLHAYVYCSTLFTIVTDRKAYVSFAQLVHEEMRPACSVGYKASITTEKLTEMEETLVSCDNVDESRGHLSS
ncbi:hypothetical protein I79_025869 [Cricetulus griseus]|uniref:Uncharacterized protein n=1 Tax=Cricetulus griseus TaxID=10029 RepID=G3IPG0_CRIGR|nr:hypothetical protein I79_025869 [Cricetulus griseus]